MMRCDECLAVLDSYIDNELTADARYRVEGHLGRCESCREECAALRSLASVFESLPYEEASSRLVAEVSLKLRDEDLFTVSLQEKAQSAKRSPIGLVAACLTLVFVVIACSVGWLVFGDGGHVAGDGLGFLVALSDYVRLLVLGRVYLAESLAGLVPVAGKVVLLSIRAGVEAGAPKEIAVNAILLLAVLALALRRRLPSGLTILA